MCDVDYQFQVLKLCNFNINIEYVKTYIVEVIPGFRMRSMT